MNQAGRELILREMEQNASHNQTKHLLKAEYINFVDTAKAVNDQFLFVSASSPGRIISVKKRPNENKRTIKQMFLEHLSAKKGEKFTHLMKRSLCYQG